MKAITNLKPPLYKLFETIRELDRQAGHNTVDLPSYFLLLETLRKGYCLTSWEEVSALCEALWLKPHHQGNPVLNREVLRQHVYVALHVMMAQDAGTTPFVDMLQQGMDLPPSPDDHQLPTPARSSPPAVKTPQAIQPARKDVQMTQETGKYNLFFGMAEGGAATSVAPLEEVTAELMRQSWSLKGGYFPVSPRKMEQHLRALRFTEKDSGMPEIDMEATISRIARNGSFDSFASKRTARHHTRWTLLIDSSDSMAAFAAFGEEIADILRQRLPGNDGQVLYFRNVVTDRLYTSPRLPGFLPWTAFTAKPAKNILIFSDAGAARGFYSEDRVIATVRMLKKLGGHKTAWLNPLPKGRWQNSSAQMISQFAGMFEIAENSLDEIANIIRLFKSKISTKA